MSVRLFLLIVMLQSAFAQVCSTGGSLENGTSEFFYELPTSGTLTSVTWSNKQLSPSDQRILYHDASTNTTNFYNGYDGRASYVEGSDIVGLRISGTTQSDIAEYEIRVSKSGVHLGFYNLTHIIPSEDLDKLEVDPCTGTGFKLKNEAGTNDIRPCDTFTLTMPDGYSDPFNVYFTQDGQVSVLNHTQCQNDPCVLEMASSAKQTVGIEVDFLLCFATEYPTIEFTIIDQTTTTSTIETPTDPTLTTHANEPITSDQVTTTIKPDSDGLELWEIIIIAIACVMVVVIITVPVVLCCCRKPNDPKLNGQKTHHELTQRDFTAAVPREDRRTDPSTAFYGGNPGTGLPPGLSGVQNAHGRSPEYHSGSVGVTPVVSDVRDKSKSVYTAQGYENQGYGYPPPDYDQHGQPHVSRVNVY